MRLGLSADEVLSTTRAVRRRLDFDRPVEREVLMECLELATQAPSGSNSQRWQWLFVTDADTKGAIAEVYRRVFATMYNPARAASMDEAGRRVWGSAGHLAEHFHEVPVMLIPCQEARPPEGGNQASFWGSLLPAVWSFMLAARERGLGTAWTTMHLNFEREVADIVGIPYDTVAQAGLFPVAYTKGTEFKPAPRKDLDGIVHWERW